MITKRIKHISHNDLDGYAATVLTELIVEAYPKDMFSLEVVNTLPNKILAEVRKTIDNIDNYDIIIITDLAIKQQLVDYIEESGHKDKFRIFDHHQTTVDSSLYDWIELKVELPDKKGRMRQTCGTELYYNFIRQDRIFDIHALNLKSDQAISHFVEVVRAYDTYEFYYKKEEGGFNLVYDDAPRLNTLFHAINHDEFKDYVNNYIHENETDFMQLTVSTPKYPWVSKIIQLDDERNKRYVESALKKLKIVHLKKDIVKDGKINEIDYHVGLVFAEKNGPMIGKAACKANPNIDFCAVVTNNQVSFYADNDDVDVSILAQLLGGGGHKQASGFTIDYVDSNWLNWMHFSDMINIAGHILPTYNTNEIKYTEGITSK